MEVQNALVKRRLPGFLEESDCQSAAESHRDRNALLEDGYEEGRAISIATAQAEKWAENRDIQVSKDRFVRPVIRLPYSISTPGCA
jgi:hypothetical protein